MTRRAETAQEQYRGSRERLSHIAPTLAAGLPDPERFGGTAENDIAPHGSRASARETAPEPRTGQSVTRGDGRVYRPTYLDKRTGEKRTSSVWWIEFWQHGKQHRESSKSRKESVARKLLRTRTGQVAVGQFVPAADRVTFEQLATMLLDDYRVNGRKSARRATASIARLREAFGALRAIEITADRIASYIGTRLEGATAPATVQKELAALRRMFTLAIRARKLTAAHQPYIPSLEIRNVRSGFFEEAEFRAVLAHLSEDVQPVAEFMYWTGWRTAETLSLTWAQVDFKQGVVRLDVGTTKNDEGRELPFAMLPELEAVLRRQRARTEAVEREAERIVPWVFHRGSRRIKDFLTGWHSACIKAGFAEVVERDGKQVTRSTRRPHDFRRTAVRRYERAGVARSVGMALTGHKTESVYRRYAIVSAADLRDGMAKVARLQQGSAEPPARVAVLGQRRASRTVPAKSRALASRTAIAEGSASD